MIRDERPTDYTTSETTFGRLVDGGHAGIPMIGDGALSPQALARLRSAQPVPLRPPSLKDRRAIAEWRRSIHEGWLDGDPTAAACGHDDVVVGGVRCLRAGVIPAAGSDGETSRPLVIYFHGGGYVLGSPEIALPITERLSAHSEVLSVAYRLAPEYPYPAAIDDGLRVYEQTVGLSGRPVVLAGDSAGANIAVSVAAKANSRALHSPAAVVLLSPHLSFETPDDRSPLRDADPMSDVDETTAAWMLDAYRGDRPNDDANLSPLHGDLTDFPPVLVQVGSSDSSFSHGVRFVRRAKAAGVDATVDVWLGMWHTWHYHRNLPEADNAIAEVGTFIASLRSEHNAKGRQPPDKLASRCL